MSCVRSALSAAAMLLMEMHMSSSRSSGGRVILVKPSSTLPTAPSAPALTIEAGLREPMEKISPDTTRHVASSESQGLEPMTCSITSTAPIFSAFFFFAPSAPFFPSPISMRRRAPSE